MITSSRIEKAYYVFWILFGLSFFALWINMRLDSMNVTFKEGYIRLTDYMVETVQDKNGPAGVRQDYTFQLEGIKNSYCHLIFYTQHQNVRVYQNETYIYNMKSTKNVMVGKSPGCVWNQLAFSESDNGSTLKISVYPAYQNVIDVAPIIYLGDRYDIIMGVVKQEIIGIVMSLFVILIGAFYCVVAIYTDRTASDNRGLMMLGFFSVQVGLWKLFDSRLITLLFPGRPVFSQVPFMALLLMCIPFILYIKELYSKDYFIWKICCIACFLDMALALVLQYNNVKDMRELLPINHVIIVAVLAIAMVLAVWEVKKYGWNLKLRRNLVGLALCTAGVFVDMLVYYLAGDRVGMIFGMFAFLTYVFVSGVAFMRDTRALIARGTSADKFKQLANHDQLTGLFNRSAYENFVNDDLFKPEKCIVAMMDLNNLKKCNDTYGHDLGDHYIKTCANLIKECFSDIGNCYRMGGDEFCVLIPNGSPTVCSERIKELKEKVSLCKPIGDGFKMAVACGYKLYDIREDYNINDTVKRADKVMYTDKVAMKQELEQQS